MKRFYVLIVLCLAGSSAMAQDVPALSRQLIDMELNRSKAIAAHDSATLDKMYAEEFNGVTALGFAVTKKDLMNVFRRDNPTVAFVNDQHKVKVLTPDVAILTGKLTGTEKASGKIIAQSLFVHVLVKRDGRWQIVQGQGTMLPAAEWR